MDTSGLAGAVILTGIGGLLLYPWSDYRKMPARQRKRIPIADNPRLGPWIRHPTAILILAILLFVAALILVLRTFSLI
jgi:hypothetical protein